MHHSRYKGVIVCDLDNTLLDTRRFKQALVDVFQKYGADFEQTHKDLRGQEISSFAKNHALFSGTDQARAQKDIELLFERLPEFLFEDVVGFFQDSALDGYYRTILTRGDGTFQKKKMSYLVPYFKITSGDACYVDNEPKSDMLADFFKLSEKVYFIDDSEQEIMSVKQAFPETVTMLINRYADSSGAAKPKEADYYVRSLKEVQVIVLNKQP